LRRHQVIGAGARPLKKALDPLQDALQFPHGSIKAAPALFQVRFYFLIRVFGFCQIGFVKSIHR
jgi:hypothetical protein